MSDEHGMPASLRERLGASVGRNLFVPSHFDFPDSAGILDFVARHPLAQIVSPHRGDLRVTATPLIHDKPLDGGETGPQHQFLGHLARRNPHSATIRAGTAGVAVLTGPDAYISPRWNVEGPSLPTWSYVAVQLRGVIEPVEGEAATREVLERTIAHMERGAERPWTLDDAPEQLVDTLIRHIVAFRFRVHDMQGIRRLNQNRKPVDREGIVRGLLETGDPGAAQIAALMQAAIEEQRRE